MPVRFRCALRGTIFIQTAHRICKTGQAGGENGLGGKHIPVTETALRRNGERAHRPFFLFRKNLDSGGTSYNMLTRWFAFVPPRGLLSASGACSATTEAKRRKRPYIGRMAKNFRPVFEFPVMVLCLSFPASQNHRKSADKLNNGRNRNPR